MTRLDGLIREIHRRSLWQVLAIYLVGAWIGYEVIQSLTEGLGLPAWFPPLAVLLFIVGLPIVLATAFVQEGGPGGSRRDPTLLPEAAGADDGDGAVRERTGRPPSGTARLLTWRNAISGGVIAFALWGVIATGYLLLYGSMGRAPAESTGISADRIAVLPFSYRGSGESAYLGEGIVDLLSATLDGAGGLRSSDARAVLRTVGQLGGGVPDPERGRAIADRLGAGRFVLGDIVEAGGRVRIHAFLHGSDATNSSEPKASVEGATDEVFELVDELTAQLLVGTIEGSSARRAQLAAVTTNSLEALKAYLEGEREYRAQRYTAAVDAFQRAVDLDTTFAMAFSGLASAAGWTDRHFLVPGNLARALRFGDRLPARERQLLIAAGDASRAEPILRDYLESYPADVEAWVSLADHLFHLGQLRGRSLADAREPFERLLFYDPEHTSALYHLAQIAAWEGNREEVDSLTRRALALTPTGERVMEMLGLRAAVLDDQAAWEQLSAGLSRSSSKTVAQTGRSFALFSGDLAQGRAVVELLTAESRSEWWRGHGHLIVASIEMAMGRPLAAATEYAAAEPFRPALALENRALVSVAPFLPATSGALEALHAQLLDWDAASVDESREQGSAFTAHIGLHPHLREFLLGLVSARLGRHQEALRHASDLEGMEIADALSSLITDLAKTVRAQVAVEQGRSAEALEILEELELEPRYGGTALSLFHTQVYARLLRAELLDAAGRSEEALRWFASLGQTTLHALPYVAPSHLRRAQIYERLGEKEKAAHHYNRFITLWEDCEPALRPLVDEAEGRLAQLTGEPVIP